MNSNEHPDNELPSAPPGQAEPASPPTKRRARKSGVLESEGQSAVAVAEGVVDKVPASKPRRRKPLAAKDLEPVAPEASTEPEPVATTSEPTTAAVRADDAPASPVPSVATVSGSGSVPPSTDGAEAADAPRRGRNRRRGRGKDRGERDPAADESGSLEVPAAQTARPPAQRPVVDSAETAARFDEVRSGVYDSEPPEPDDEASLEQLTKRVLRPDPEAPKLHKVLAQSGIGSRRDMEQLIVEGAVTVNDVVAHVGMRIGFGDRIAVNGKPVRVRIQGSPARLLAYHKPAGEVVTFNDPEGRPTVFRRLPRLQNGKWQSVGRLDINTEGLLLLTTSGELANQLMHPRFGVEREYAVRVLGSLDDEKRSRLLVGVEIEGQTAGFQSIEDGGGEGANRWYRVVITEGRNREVRKLFDKVGLAVSRLIRIRYGTVVLPRGLKRGVWVELGDEDLRAIRQLASGGRNELPRGEAPVRRETPGGPGAAGRQSKRGPQGPRPAQAAERPPRREREPRPPGATDRNDPDAEDFTRIPNPLEQTFDRRFASGPRRGAHQGFGQGGSKPDADFGPGGTIPNPLEQTFDKRFVKGSQRINAGFGRPDGDPHGAPAGAKKVGPKQPDPMQTSVGYIGADAYFNKVGGKRGGNRGGAGGGGGGGGRRGR